MKLRRFLLAILIATASLQAQVGIGTNDPKSRLDVNGDVKIGNEGQTDAQGEPGTIRWSEEKNCFEGRDLTKWKCLDYKPTFDIDKPMLELRGGEALRYNKGQGWENNEHQHDRTRNVVKLNVKSGTNKDIYKDGTITIPEDGTYKLNYLIRLVNEPAKGAFDGTCGTFFTWITINEKQASSRNFQTVFRGAKVTGGALDVSSISDQILYLKKGDRLHVRFNTYGTDSMNDDSNNIYLDRDASSITLWKL